MEGERAILCNKVYSQAELHEKYGGVVPEIASRNHLKKLSPLLEEALEEAGVDLREIELIASTYGPGLVGPLLVGVSLGKSLAYGLDLPFLGVNHLEGHIFANYLRRDMRPPFVALLVSGGHTNLLYVKDWGEYRNLGQTRDDAAGEAFDKVGYMTDLGYPAGPKIDEKSKAGDPAAIEFPRPMIEEGLDFSFAGLKTAVSTHIGSDSDYDLADLLASFQEAVVDTLVTKAIRAAHQMECGSVSVIGGVAANSRLRSKFREESDREGLRVSFPSLDLCTDNAAMIAACGKYRYSNYNEQSSYDLGPAPSLKLGEPS